MTIVLSTGVSIDTPAIYRLGSKPSQEIHMALWTRFTPEPISAVLVMI